MGEVYQATDSKLGRSVAIKLLPAAFASNAERLARFQREAFTPACRRVVQISGCSGHRLLLLDRPTELETPGPTDFFMNIIDESLLRTSWSLRPFAHS